MTTHTHLCTCTGMHCITYMDLAIRRPVSRPRPSPLSKEEVYASHILFVGNSATFSGVSARMKSTKKKKKAITGLAFTVFSHCSCGSATRVSIARQKTLLSFFFVSNQNHPQPLSPMLNEHVWKQITNVWYGRLPVKVDYYAFNTSYDLDRRPTRVESSNPTGPQKIMIKFCFRFQGMPLNMAAYPRNMKENTWHLVTKP